MEQEAVHHVDKWKIIAALCAALVIGTIVGAVVGANVANSSAYKGAPLQCKHCDWVGHIADLKTAIVENVDYPYQNSPAVRTLSVEYRCPSCNAVVSSTPYRL